MPAIGNDNIARRIKRYGAEGTARSIDIAAVRACGAKRRQTRRNTWRAFGGFGVAGITAVIAIAAVNLNDGGQPESNFAGPGCAPFGASLVDAADSATAIRTLNAKVSSELTLNAVIPDTPNARYTTLDVIIAKPGATVDVGPPDQLPATSAGRPENQLYSGRINAPGAKFTLAARSPGAPGTYPIVAYGTYVTAIGCKGPVPADPDKQQTGTYAFEMGTLVVAP